MTCGLFHLRRRADFVAAAKSGRSWATTGLVLQIRPRDKAENDRITDIDDAAIRLGITATRKLGNAVVRNRVRRRLRAVAREVLAHHGTLSRDYVLIGRPATATRSFEDLLNDLRLALKRLHAYRKNVDDLSTKSEKAAGNTP